MTPLDFRSDGHIRANTFNRRIFRFQDEAEQGTSSPGKPETVRALSCAECVHGKTRFGCSLACPYYDRFETRGTPVLAGVVAELATAGVGAV